jgi:hypothetical protein
MDIGQHFLEGELTSLKMPFLITEKTKDTSTSASESGGSADDNSQAEASLSIVGIVKKKVIFNTRPKPLGLKRLRDED